MSRRRSRSHGASNPNHPFGQAIPRLIDYASLIPGLAALAVETPTPSPPPAPATPPAAPAIVYGYWRGESGSLLRFDKVPGTDGFTVTGTALNQKVQGDGTIEGDRLKIRLMLEVKRIALTLNLAMPTCESDWDADRLTGTASDGTGADRPANFPGSRWTSKGPGRKAISRRCRSRRRCSTGTTESRKCGAT